MITQKVDKDSRNAESEFEFIEYQYLDVSRPEERAKDAPQDPYMRSKCAVER